MNFKGSRNIGSSSTAKLLTSKGRIEVYQIGDPLFYGLWIMLNQIHRILSMNFGEMRIKNDFIRASELKRKDREDNGLIMVND